MDKRKTFLALKTLFFYLLTSALVYLVAKNNKGAQENNFIRDYYYYFSFLIHILAYFWLTFKKREPQRAVEVQNKLNSKISYSSFFLVFIALLLFGIVVVYISVK